MSNFNEQQQSAIDLTPYKNLLITAGAGSGKTKTLSSKVFKVLSTEYDGKKIQPSEILVLTFTNNAAHEMKERIIGEFKNDPEFQKKVVSSHIQTFDSFSAYLVKKYSGALKISDQFGMLSGDIETSKIHELANEIILEYYQDPLKGDAFRKMVSKFNTTMDDNTVNVVIDLYYNLNKLIKSKREEFINNYDEVFLSKKKFDEAIKIICDNFKELIRNRLYYVRFALNNRLTLGSEKITYEELNGLFNDKCLFEKELDLINTDFESLNTLYALLFDLLKLDNDDFYKECVIFKTVNDKLLKIKNSKKIDPFLYELYKVLRIIFGTANALIDMSNYSPNLLDEYNRLLSFKEDIHLLLSIYLELEERLTSYKKKINAYTFSDIANMAIDLVTQDMYQDIQEEIRESFKFIMVDEYQDTNDFQELFIDSLLKEKKDGTRSHLFCVGDAKQAIYAFRNSNVELFKKREEKYRDEPNKVIAMNKNYRSGKKLLSDINYIFKHYMTKKHGGIDFTQPMEQLTYDDSKNIYGLPYDNFGVKRITSVSGSNNDLSKASNEEWEARAIINDINKKIQAGYLVYDLDDPNKLRPCTYKDFTIIVRKKAGFKLYQKLFNEANIPLNNTMASVLQEADVVIVLESLLRLIKNRLDHNFDEFKINFASVARSYLYQMEDDELYQLLKQNDEEILNNQILVDIDNFINNNQKSSFKNLFTNLLKEFKIIEKLYLIGNVCDNVQKVELLFQAVLTYSDTGQGIDAFIELFITLNKYKLTFSADTVVELENAVDIMSIHGSKGLQRKIVYLPYTYNKYSSGSPFGADYIFSKEFGLILPDYDFDIDDLNENYRKNNKTLYNLVYKYSLGNEDVSEHVRLFYVALTRAENTVYIVGDPKDSEEKNIEKETLYGMLNHLPHHVEFNEKILNKLIDNNLISSELLEEYNLMIKNKFISNPPLKEVDFTSNYDIYQYIYDNLGKLYINERIDKIIFSLEKAIFNLYKEELKDVIYNNNNNTELLSKFVLLNEFNRYKDDTYVFLTDESITEDSFKDNISEEDSFKETDLFNEDTDVAKSIHSIQEKLEEYEKTDSFGKEADYKKFNKFILSLVYTFDDEKYVTKTTYQTTEFDDIVEPFNINSLYIETSAIKPEIVEVEEFKGKIEFDKRVHKKASKPLIFDDDVPNFILDRGTRLHRLLELTNLSTKDTSFIKNQEDKAFIDKALTNEIFNLCKDSDVRKEFSYFDNLNGTTGFIDLLIIKDNEYYIVDYKTSNIDDEEYDVQLNTYARNVKTIFKCEDSHIHKYLLSLTKGNIREVK